MRNSKMKSRKELAKELGISRRTFYSKLKAAEIELPSGKISPKHQEIIFKELEIR